MSLPNFRTRIIKQICRRFRRFPEDNAEQSAYRIARYLAFVDFFDNSETRLLLAARDLGGMDHFRMLYSFLVSPGSRNGGSNDRIVEVFFGQKPFDSSLTGPGGASKDARSVRLHVESGAALRYERLDDGFVACILEPAETERRHAPEDMILLAKIDPRGLSNERALRGHLRWLIAYMAATSLDGAITIPEQIRVAWLRAFKRRYKDKRQLPIAAWAATRLIVRWTLTVGLSGALLAVIQRYVPPRLPMNSPLRTVFVTFPDCQIERKPEKGRQIISASNSIEQPSNSMRSEAVDVLSYTSCSSPVY